MSAQRIVTAVVLTPLVVASMFLPTPYVAAIAAGLFLLGLWEWSQLVGIKGQLWRALYVMVNIALMTALPWGHGLPLFGPVSLVGVVWWLFALLWLLRPDFGREASGWSCALKLVAGTLSTIPAWCALVLLHYGNSDATHVDANGPRWALFGLVMVWAADSCAYFVGVRFGKRKLVPRISPGKTWAGPLGRSGRRTCGRPCWSATARRQIRADAVHGGARPAHCDRIGDRRSFRELDEAPFGLQGLGHTDSWPRRHARSHRQPVGCVARVMDRQGMAGSVNQMIEQSVRDLLACRATPVRSGTRETQLLRRGAP
jgi:hypothetical protein